MAMRLRWLLLAGLLVLGACAAIDLKERMTREEMGHLKRVGVVSLLDDAFIGISVGAAVINTHHYTGSVADWNIDGYAEGQALAILRQNGQFAAAALDHSNLDADQLRADHSRLVWELAGRQGFDTVVSLWPSLSGNFPLFKPGYGLYDYPSKGPGHRCIYVSYTVEVYDVASRKRVAWEWGGAAPCKLGSEQTLEFKNSFAEYTDAEKLLMRKAVEARIAETLAGALTQLGLVPAAARAP
jgi:hypothetical protein